VCVNHIGINQLRVVINIQVVGRRNIDYTRALVVDTRIATLQRNVVIEIDGAVVENFNTIV
jgi:hypothetical protein